MAFRNGIDFVVYYSTTPFTAVPDAAAVTGATWAHGNYTQSLDNNRSRQSESFSIRGAPASGGQSINQGGSRTGEISISSAYNTDDTFYDALETAYEDGVELAIADMDGPIATSGSKGSVGNYAVTAFNKSEGNTGVATVTATLTAGEFVEGRFVVA